MSMASAQPHTQPTDPRPVAEVGPAPESRDRDLPLRFGAHFRVTEVTMRFDVGDEIARRHGSPMATTSCCQDVVSTVTTRRRDLVRCPACLEALAQQESGGTDA